MKRLTMFLLVFLLVPASASADDGGFWDWLWRMGPKFWGIGSEIHLVCLDANGNRVNDCERGFSGLWHLITARPALIRGLSTFDTIKHEVDFRFTIFRKYGDRFSNDTSAVPDTRSIYAAKLMGMYHYHVTHPIEVGAGAGVVPFFGDGFQAFARGIVTPISLVVAPFREGKGRALTLRIEESYLTGELSGNRLGNGQVVFGNQGEWNFSFAAGFDLRRLSP